MARKRRTENSQLADAYMSALVRSMTITLNGTTTTRANAPVPDLLADRMAEQIGTLTKGFKGKGGVEMAKPEPDLHTYRDAFASAAENCEHDDATELLYQREWVCDDCHKVLDRDAMRRARGSRSYWSWGY